MQHGWKRVLYILVLGLGLVWIWYSADPREASAGLPPVARSGFLAPDFSLELEDGGSVTLSDLRGQAVIINFWASWCPPCRQEMPALQRVHAEYAPDGLVLLAVNAANQDAPQARADFLAGQGFSFPVLLDRDGAVQALYLVTSLPTTVFIGRDGVISEIMIGGPLSEALLRSRAEELLQAVP